MRFITAVAATALALSMLPALAQAQEPDLHWHSSTPNKDAVFGEPETDNRLLRLRCLPNGTLELSGPAPGSPTEELTEGQKLQVAVTSNGVSQKIGAKVEERGDGWNFVAIVDGGNASIASLSNDQPVHVARGKYGFDVPGKGAGPLIKKVVAACKPQAKAQTRDDAGAMMKLWHEANGQCRGGGGDDPKTFAACDEREVYGKRLDTLGWCYGKRGQAGYQMSWHKCTATSVRYDG